MKFSYSTDGEFYEGSFVSRKEAHQEALDAEGDEAHIYTAVVVPKKLSEFTDPDVLMEYAHERADDDGIGEHWDYKTISMKAEQAFTTMIDNWAEKHDLVPTCWNVTDVIEHGIGPFQDNS